MFIVIVAEGIENKFLRDQKSLIGNRKLQISSLLGPMCSPLRQFRHCRALDFLTVKIVLIDRVLLDRITANSL